MTLTYLDTSAAMKLLVEEAESQALVIELLESGRRLAASWLLHTELHCAAGRNPAIISGDSITQVIDAITLVDVTRGDMLAAGTHAPLRSNDAVHLATALRIGADELITYDAELAHAARSAGIRVLTPAADDDRRG
ncbi:type II toxin-antitoxin system VapC family toxin [Herbiconiux sp. 11R-BC]|uniref:type II toxin-antitoxin system VapC family toxin n=1 Tax=Herbiconiux sp. 11R-BC TaxID=3111637 RepID=UPI003C045521